MNMEIYFIVLIGVSIIPAVLLVKKQIQRGMVGCAIITFIFFPIVLASFVWCCTLLLLLYLNGGV